MLRDSVGDEIQQELVNKIDEGKNRASQWFDKVKSRFANWKADIARAVAGEIRKDIDFQLMQNPAIKISEVSDIPGYSGPAAFRKAFKSWTNVAPRAVRKVGV